MENATLINNTLVLSLIYSLYICLAANISFLPISVCCLSPLFLQGIMVARVELSLQRRLVVSQIQQTAWDCITILIHLDLYRQFRLAAAPQDFRDNCLLDQHGHSKNSLVVSLLRTVLTMLDPVKIFSHPERSAPRPPERSLLTTVNGHDSGWRRTAEVGFSLTPPFPLSI